MLSQALPQLQRLVSDSPCSKAALELLALLPPSPHPKISDLCYRSQLQMLTQSLLLSLWLLLFFQDCASTCNRSSKTINCLICQIHTKLQMVEMVVSSGVSRCPLSFPPLNISLRFFFQNKHHYNCFLFTSLVSPWLLPLSLVDATPLNLLPSANIISYCLFPLPHY